MLFLRRRSLKFKDEEKGMETWESGKEGEIRSFRSGLGALLLEVVTGQMQTVTATALFILFSLWNSTTYSQNLRP